MIYIVMGVSGSGKTTVGALLAKERTLTFADADDYHPAANKEKMASGHPLDDDDRRPWLLTLNQLLLGWQAASSGGVLACSALKDAYRDLLTAGIPEESVVYIFLDPSPAVLAARLKTRQHAFMNPVLLTSQLATLEAPGDEAWHISVDGTPAESLALLEAKLKAAGAVPIS